jgi:hypothetical protein
VIYASVALHLAVGLAAYAYHPVAKAAGIQLTRGTDPFRRLMGWDLLAHAVGEQLYQHPGAVLMTDERMLFALMGFYIKPHPVQVQWNPDGKIQNHFELTTDIRKMREAEILYMTANPDPAGVLEQFREHGFVATVSIPVYSDLSRRYSIWRVKGFKG